MEKLYYSKVTVDGRCVDLLLTETEIEIGVDRALKNPDVVVKNPEAYGNCWTPEKPPKCGFWNRIMNKCCQCNREV